MANIKEEQRYFVLKNDMVPINFRDHGPHGSFFICPLPRGYKTVIKNKLYEIEEWANKTKDEINVMAEKKEGPFENILFGYLERTEEQQQDLLKEFKINRVSVDNRGVYSVWADKDCNNGDIYLSSESRMNHDNHIFGMKDFFEPNTAFECHNIDFYWHALLTREFSVRYFNFLNKLLWLIIEESKIPVI